jgi:hypothetical protein
VPVKAASTQFAVIFASLTTLDTDPHESQSQPDLKECKQQANFIMAVYVFEVNILSVYIVITVSQESVLPPPLIEL